MASTYLTRTPSSTGNQRTFTFSFWVKRGGLSSQQHIYCQSYGSEDYQFRIEFTSNDEFRLYNSKGASDAINLKTNRRFRDTSSWYAITIAIDTTQGTEANRAKIYVNGVQETSFATATYPTQNLEMDANAGVAQLIGVQYKGSYALYFDGLMSHFHFVDGTAYQASTFGSTDSTTGEWKIKTNVTATYGTNGFFILKDGNSVTDQSGNSNNFTLGAGQITNLKDNPSHNFCNINLLYQQTTGEGVVVNNCGNTVYYASNASRSCFGSIAPSSGKYYFEAKVFGGTGTVVIGIVNLAWSGLNGAVSAFHDNALNFGYNVSGQTTSGGSNTAYGSAISDGDIVGVAMDLDNSKLYFSLNGVFQGSGVPTSGASGTNAAFTLASGANYTGACRLRNGTQVGFNFGNGQYSGSNLVTTNSGDGYSGAEGSSKFSYQPPTGYSAISTKGLNE